MTLTDKILALLNERDRIIDEAVEKLVEKNRKYPNGFSFPYESSGEIAEITGATLCCDPCSREEVNEYLISRMGIHVVYLCYVPSWCDSPDGRKTDRRVRVPEFDVDRAIGTTALRIAEE